MPREVGCEASVTKRCAS